MRWKSFHSFPPAHLAGNNLEQWMRRGDFQRRQFAQQLRVALFQFPFEVPPFVKQLAARLLGFPRTFRSPIFLASNL